MADLADKLDTLPDRPGVYMFKDADGEILYVGKAKNLRNRVRSYFREAGPTHPRTLRLLERVADFDILSTDSEIEALILEANLVKEHKPRYNISLQDDKRYPYIKVHWADPYPKVTITRRMVRDSSRYFGPYTSMAAVHQSVDALRRAFPFLSCDREITGQDERACLYVEIFRHDWPVDSAAAAAALGYLATPLEEGVARLLEPLT